jgi:hypothetical protein
MTNDQFSMTNWRPAFSCWLSALGLAIAIAGVCQAQSIEIPAGRGVSRVMLETVELPKPPAPVAPIITAYDLEKHLGVVAFDRSPEVTKRNCELLNAAMDAMHPAGKFRFVDGSVGPLLFPIQAAGKTFYFTGRLQTGRKLGGAILGVGGHAQVLGDGEFGPNGQGGAITRFVRMDPDPKGCVLRVRSGGFKLSGVQLYGRPKPGNIESGEGPKTGAGIQYEGRDLVAQTSGLIVSEFVIADCDIGVHFLGGYYDDAGKFVEDKNHGDNATFTDGSIGNCRVGIRSDNEQAVWNVFDQVTVGKANDPLECVIEANAGGLWATRSLRVASWDTTLLKLGPAFSPNNSRFDIHFYRDGGVDGPNRLTLVEYAGKGEPWMDFDVRFSGSIANESQAKDMRELFRLNGISPKNIRVDVTNIEHVPGVNWEVDDTWRRVK